jgi:hypothetical protein
LADALLLLLLLLLLLSMLTHHYERLDLWHPRAKKYVPPRNGWILRANLCGKKQIYHPSFHCNTPHKLNNKQASKQAACRPQHRQQARNNTATYMAE